MGSLMCLTSLPGGQDGGADQASLSPLIVWHLPLTLPGRSLSPAGSMHVQDLISA